MKMANTVIWSDTAEEGKKGVTAHENIIPSHSEARFTAHKLKFLALKWALTDQYQYFSSILISKVTLSSVILLGQ